MKQLKQRKPGQTLSREKPRQLGIFEKYYMKFLGKRDGKLELPRMNKEGIWISANLRKEMDALNEYEAKLWRDLEVNLAAKHVGVENIRGEIKHNEKQLAELNALSEREQRQDEKTEEPEEIAVKKMRIENTLKKLQNRVVLLKAEIHQAECQTRLHCEKVKNRTNQRIDSYWMGANMTHTLVGKMPPEPRIIYQFSPEILYLRQHNTDDYVAIRLKELETQTQEAV